MWRDLYEAEVSRRDRLRGSLSLPVGVLTVVGGALVATTASFPAAADWRLATLFWIFSTAAVVAGLLCATHLVRSFHGRTYSLIASPKLLREHYLALDVWHKNSQTLAHQDAAKADFSDWLDERYVEAADHNRNQNNQASKELFVATRCLAWCLIATCLTYPTYVLAKRSEKPAVHRVQVETGEFMNKSTEQQRNNAPSPTPSPSPSPSPGPSPLTKPVGPPNEFFREGVESPPLTKK